jgi:hypothetical protein
LERGNGTGKHRSTGRQRSEPEDGKPARQPDGRAGGEGRPAAGTDAALRLLVPPSLPPEWRTIAKADAGIWLSGRYSSPCVQRLCAGCQGRGACGIGKARLRVRADVGVVFGGKSSG